LPLTLDELSLWIAFICINLLISSELLSAHYGGLNVYLDRRKLRVIAVVYSLVFALVILLQIPLPL
jgi:hypothetical protein